MNRNSIALRLCAIGAGLVLAITAGMGRVQAHPLGNFAINHLARLQPESGRLRVHYVLDIAEIPTFQIMHGAGAWSPQAMRIGRTRRLRWSQRAFRYAPTASRCPCRLIEGGAHCPGAGGLPILYWTGDYTTRLPVRAAISVRDSVYGDRRIG